MPQCSCSDLSITNNSYINTVLNSFDRLEKTCNHNPVIVYILEGKARQFWNMLNIFSRGKSLFPFVFILAKNHRWIPKQPQRVWSAQGHGTGLHCCRNSSTAQCDVSQREPKDSESPPCSWISVWNSPRAKLIPQGCPEQRPCCWREENDSGSGLQMSRVSLQREEEGHWKRKATSWSQELLESWAI